MDALGVLLWQKEPVVFMARAKMFAHPFVGKLLRTIKIMPIYRLKDGYSHLSKNEPLMQEATEVLIRKHRLCLMPEGGQDGHRHLRGLVKGLFRIACQAQEELKDSPVYVLPVGIDYSEHEHSGSDILIHFGKPIKVSGFMDLYRQEPALAYNAMRDVLASKIAPLMHDIRNMEQYERIYKLSWQLTPAYLDTYGLKNTPENRFDARCAISRMIDPLSEKAPEKWQQLSELSQNLDALPCSPHVVNWLTRKESALFSLWTDILSGILCFPACLLDFPVWALIHRILRWDKDSQMQSTYRFALSAICLPFWYLLLSVLTSLLAGLSFPQALLLYGGWMAVGIWSEKSRCYLRETRFKRKALFAARGARRTDFRSAYQKLAACYQALSLESEECHQQTAQA